MNNTGYLLSAGGIIPVVMLFVLLFMAKPCSASSGDLTDEDFSKETRFILYLMGRGDLDESLFLIDRLEPSGMHQADSLSYLGGWVLYMQQRLEESASRLLNVSETSPFYHKSRFFGAYNLAHTGNTSQASAELSAIRVGGGSMHEAMRDFQMGGVALLERDFGTYEHYQQGFSGSYHVMAREESQMRLHYDKLRDNPPRSAFVGGLLSAAVPGLGRVYAGKAPEGIVSFLYVAAMGLVSYDIYRGRGAQSPCFVISATTTGIFYIGNIAGSAAAVRRSNEEFRHEINQRILFDMHIPLRNAFN